MSLTPAQEPPALPTVSVTPVSAEVVLTTGQTVSRPLQAVALPEAPKPGTTEPPPTKPDSVTTPEPAGGLPSSWSRYDFLLWFPKAQPLPPLLTVSPVTSVPNLGGSQTALLVGNSAIDTPTSGGGRFTWGWACGNEPDAGIEFTYLFTGTRSAEAFYDGTNRNLRLGRPVIDGATGNEAAIPVSSPGGVGRFYAETQNRMSGWEVNGVFNLIHDDSVTINALAGYRFFLNHEGVRLDQVTNLSPTLYANAADQFDGHTRFHGGQIGLDSTFEWNRLYVGMIGKVGFGRSFEVVKIGGQTNFISTAGGLPVQGGVLAVGSNTGRYANSTFAVLPEGQFNIGYRFRDHSRLFVGYNFLYLSDAVRPGDQIDRTVDPTSIPILVNGVPVPGTRPEFSMKRTDFWVHGITIGFEYKY